MPCSTARLYYTIHGNIVAWDTTEADVRQFAQTLAIKDFYIQVSTAPGAGKSWAFAVMKNGSPTAVTVTISDTDTIGSDLSNEVRFADDDWISLRAIPSGTPAAANARWGLVQAEALSSAPTVTTQANSDTIAEKSTGHGVLNNKGSSDVTQHGHCWSTLRNPTTSDSKTQNGAAPNLGHFQSDITGLTPGTTYYVRAYATNTQDTAYGDDVSITADSSIGRRYWWVESGEFHFWDEWGTERFLTGTKVGDFE